MLDRVMIAGTESGCGKTSLTCALLTALVAMGKSVFSFKCGPDYIDPMFHKKATGVESRNLDIYMMGAEGVINSVARHASGCDIAVMEGVMGLYDGLGNGSYSSSNHVSLLTNTPVILIVNAKGIALSLCAKIKGYLEFEDNNIRAIILNNVSERMFGYYKQMIEDRLGVSVIGYMPHIPEASIESRHLGLVAADEIADIKEKLRILGEHALRCIDMEKLLLTAGQSGELISKQGPTQGSKQGPTQGPTPQDIAYGRSCQPCDLTASIFMEHYSAPLAETAIIYVTRDEALSFCYEDNHDMLNALGAKIKYISLIHDSELPGDADGLIIWGGYPELYGQALESNNSMMHSIKAAVAAGLPVYAECGGFMYLQESITDIDGKTFQMLGVLPGRVRMTSALHNFGYYEMRAQRDNLLCEAGDKINAIFSRYSVSDCEGDCFVAVKENGKSFPCVVSEGNIFAGYQHLHFLGNPKFAKNYVNACIRFKGIKSS